ncbi:hypothetical protein F4779DRAFT_618231 [Xylariaceae sp. FL0662B]|nr:hypothetical protein F4779DRAFT_618231 [Xylariaceae sp. FL0662B]
MASRIDSSAKPPSTTPAVFRLPDEILHEICRHCLQSDWICLSLVCKRFRELAAAQLYRNFHIVFPDEDDPCFDSPIDGLAGGLDSFVTSDYNYAKHLRDLSLDTLSVGDKAEAAYKPYLTNVSCGKFMNTLLLLTLRKAKSLDRFRWNIRVELSRPVYKALHDIKSLRHLHIRLQAGPSLYDEPPPPLPYLTSQFPAYPASPPMSPAITWITPTGPQPIPVTTSSEPFSFLVPPPPASKPSSKNKLSKRSPTAKEPLTVAGFKALQTLAILDIDNLDIITEIKTCIQNSSSTLKKLKLSFSDALAMQARTPSPDADADESEDDEFQVVPLATTVNYDSNGPAKVFRAQEERKAQESALGRIFEVEPSRIRSCHASSADRKGKEKEPKEQLPSNDGERFIDGVNKVFQRMAAHVYGTNDPSILEQQGTLDAIAKAARKYVDSEEAKAAADSPSKEQSGNNDTSSSSKEGKPSSISGDSLDEKILTPATEETQAERQPKTMNVDEGLDPEDIDIAVPEEQLGVDDELNTYMTAVGSEKVSTFLSTTGMIDRIVQTRIIYSLDDIWRRFEEFADDISKEIREADKLDENGAKKCLAEAGERLESIHRDVKNIGQEMNVVEADMNDGDAQLTPIADEKQEQLRRVNQYARGTRGIALDSLSLHLIPVKASVVGKALDLHALRRLTLLNVGEQRKFWTLMMRENNLQPLPLRKVFTDDVCLPFLQLVSELSCVDEVFMLQRSSKYKPESFAPNPGTTIQQIRKFVLRKHLHTLKRLMIKNHADKSWDVDEKTIQLICRRGQVLEELAVAMGMRAFHTLIQSIASLVNLRALQLVSFRTDDTCVSVVREARRFIVDAISHHPELKLEWLAISEEDRAMRIVRKSDAPKKQKKKSIKGKEVATGSSSNHNLTATFPSLPTDVWDDTSDSEEDDGDDSEPGLRLELIEGFAFYDVYGIRIFKKEIATGRL